MLRILLRALLLPMVCALLTACRAPSEPDGFQPLPRPVAPHVENELLCTTDTRESAEDIARQYGITLQSWSDGLAVFYTERDVQEVIEEGKRNGWPLLHLNMIYQLF